MRWAGLISAAAVILAANALALIRVAGNRAGDPVETIELTERELPLQNLDPDNSGAVLRLTWSQPAPYPATPLGRQEMEAAGFDFSIPPGTRSRDLSLTSREAYVALEYAGKAWEQAVAQARAAPLQALPPPQPQAGPLQARNDPAVASRLYIAGTSRSAEDLRRRYPDQSRYLIVRALLHARIEDVEDPGTGKVTAYNCYGYMSDILPSTIFVPLPHGKLLSSLPKKSGPEPRYSVVLRYGQDLEPWVESVKLR